jgi:long-chain fatty acid transport protein
MRKGFGTGRRAVLMAGAALGAAGVAGSAQASGFALLEQSATYQGASYAGAAARSDDPSTLFYNPAGMTQLPGYQFSISGSVIMPQANLNAGSASLNTPYGPVPAGGTVGHDAGESVLLPSFYATAQVAPDWHVGLAVNSPFGLSTKYEPDSIARYYALTSSLVTTDFAPSVAWQPLPTLSVAAGLRVEIADARLSKAVDFGSLGALYGIPGFAPGQNDGISSVKGNDTAVGWQVGLLYEPVPGTKIGFDYRSPIFHKLSGSIAFTGVPGPLAPSPVFSGANAVAKLVTPDTFSLSLAKDIAPVTLLASLDYTLWSRFKDLLVNYPGGSSLTQENWNNTFMFSLGADWHVTDTVTLRSGAAVDVTPVSDAYRTPRIPDNNRYWLSLGATWKPIPKLAISAAYSHIFVTGSSVNQLDLGPGTPNFGQGNLQASYNNQINILSLEATLAF